MLPLWTWFKSSCASRTGFPGRKPQNSGIVTRCASHPGAKKMHLHFFTFSCPFCPCVGSKPKKCPEVAMGCGIGPLNVAMESVTTAGVGVLSQTPTDPSQFLNFFRFRERYEVVPLIQHPVLGHSQQATSTGLQTKSRIPSQIGKDYHSHSTTAWYWILPDFLTRLKLAKVNKSTWTTIIKPHICNVTRVPPCSPVRG